MASAQLCVEWSLTDDPGCARAGDAIAAERVTTIDLRYGEYEGGQRMVSRFALTPLEDGIHLAGAAHHRNLDRPNPR